MGEPSAPQPESDLRLDSWKDIAAYLGRTERTVRRWEQNEGLPVHRLAHEKRSSVYAYRTELDAWLASRKQVVEAPEPSPARFSMRPRALWGAVAAAALVLGTWWLVHAWSAPSLSSIAVLPFENLSHDPAEEWFSDGMTETLIAELSKLHSLKVISRTSVMQYKGTRKSLKEISRNLGVDVVVESSALRVGERVRITAQLIAAHDDSHLWANTYDADMKDALSVQRDIAGAIAREIGVRISPDERDRRAKPRSSNPEAMAEYLRGLYQYNQAALRPAAESARRAIRLDPNLADAHILLGETLELWAAFHGKTYAEVVPEARAALQRALELEPENGVALAWLGDTYFFGEHDWVHGEEYFRRGYELDPSTGNNYAFLLAAQGKLDDAIRVINRALLNDPANPNLLTDAARIHQFAHRYDDMIRYYRKALEVNPGSGYAREHIVGGLLLAGRDDAALEEFLWPSDRHALADAFRQSYRAGGWQAVWRTYLERVPAAPSWQVARRFALLFLRRDQEALDMLDQLEKLNDSWMMQLEDPIYNHLRKQPRFKALLQRVGYPEPMWR